MVIWRNLCAIWLPWLQDVYILQQGSCEALIFGCLAHLVPESRTGYHRLFSWPPGSGLIHFNYSQTPSVFLTAFNHDEACTSLTCNDSYKVRPVQGDGSCVWYDHYSWCILMCTSCPFCCLHRQRYQQSAMTLFAVHHSWHSLKLL
jgi:hypothetical protein